MRIASIIIVALSALAGCQQDLSASEVREFDQAMEGQALDDNGCPGAQMSRLNISHGEAVKRCACVGEYLKKDVSKDNKLLTIRLMKKMSDGSISFKEMQNLTNILQGPRIGAASFCAVQLS